MRTRTVFVSVLAIALFAWFLSHANIAGVWTQVQRARIDLLVAGFLAVVATYVIRAWRWQYLLQPIGPTRFRTAFRTTVIGFAALGVLPARAGDVLRPYLLARQEGLMVSATFATIVIERVLDLIAVIALLALYVWGMADAASMPPGLLRGIEVSSAVAGIGATVLMALMWILATHPERIGGLVFAAARMLPHAVADRLAGLATHVQHRLCRHAGAARAGDSDRMVVSALAGHRGRSMARDDGLRHSMPFAGTFLLQALLVIGVAVPTPGASGAITRPIASA